MIEIAVFVCGAVVMTYEITGARILAPYIGTSIYIWTSLIGVVLASLSLGYWLGGRTADRSPRIAVLAAAVFAAASLVSLTILVKEPFLAFVAVLPAALEVRSLIASFFLFAPASVALGYVIPYATKLRIASLDRTGRTVGRLYALSTVGSITGTFAAGFLFVPALGSTRTLYLLAAALFLVALLLAPFVFTRTNFSGILLFAFAILGSESWTHYLQTSVGIRELDTRYSRVRIFDSVDPRSGRPIRLMMTDPFFAQSAKYLDGADLALDYTRFYHLAAYFRPGFRRALMIGGAGFSFPQAFLRTYPDATIDVVEIDPAMTKIAEEHFGLIADPRLTIFHEDGRVFLNRSASAGYDAVFIDAFGSLFAVPHQLTTVEAAREIERVLDADGLVIFNIGSAISGRGASFLDAEVATFRSVFPMVRLFRVDARRPDDDVQNVILVAQKRILHENDGLPVPEFSAMLAGEITGHQTKDSMILTDDLSPVERFNSIALDVYRRQRR